MPPSPRRLLRATRHLRRADPVLARIIADLGRCRLRVNRGAGHFASLVQSIVYQQITGKAAESILARLYALVPGPHPRPEDIARASDRDLRNAGLSRQKIAYLRDLAERVQQGFPLSRIARLPDEDVIEALTAVKGIGRWTAEMFLIFRLGRPDVFPVDDYGVRKAMQHAYRRRQLPKADWMRCVADPWRPYRSAASWYLWRYLEGRSRAKA